MSAWEQWGGRKPASSGLQSAQDALSSLLRSSPMSTASNATTESEGSVSSSLKKAWKSARDLTMSAMATPTASKDADDAMESGKMNENVDKSQTGVNWPLGRKDPSSQSVLTSTMSW